jgi:hypothetical protein
VTQYSIVIAGIPREYSAPRAVVIRTPSPVV